MDDMLETVSGCQPRLTTTAYYPGVEKDKAKIRAGDRTQRALTNRTWSSYLSWKGYKRTMRGADHLPRKVTEQTLVAPPTYAAASTANKEAAVRAFMRRFALKRTDADSDPATVGVVTKRKQRRALKKAQKQEHRQLDPATAYQVSRQLEVKERENMARQHASEPKRSLRKTIKMAMSKTKTPSPHMPIQPADTSLPVNADMQQQFVPTLDDFASKQRLNQYFDPSALESARTHDTAQETSPEPCELPATSASPSNFRLADFVGDIAKKRCDLGYDAEMPPPLTRSPSPCLSSCVPRRGITLSEAPADASSKQMQCDGCHESIKMTCYYYACDICDRGDRIYCSKCANDGSTCRHELVEKTRAIKRHPTNPQYLERRNIALRPEPISPVATLQQIEQPSLINHDSISCVPARANTFSTLHESASESTQHIRELDSSGQSQTRESLNTSQPALDLLKDMEAKRREQDVAFREKEVTLREREAALREREAIALSRDREAVMMQQLHAAAVLQNERAAEVGAQFAAAMSRQSSCCSQKQGISRTPSHGSAISGIILEPSEHRPKDGSALNSMVRAFERASLSLPDGGRGVNSRGNKDGASKRRTPEKTQSGTQQRKSQKEGPGNTRRTSSKRSNDDTGEEEEYDDDGAGSPKRPKHGSPVIAPDRKLFACPFHKHDPIRYSERNTTEMSYRGCASGVLRDISRVKQHLKRTHHMPDSYCRRCFEVFPGDSELDRHSSQSEACQARECPFPERIDSKKQGKIHIKRPGKNPEALWFEIYSVIFPGAEPPNSPYVESSQPKYTNRSTIDSFWELFERELDNCSSNAHLDWTQDFETREWLRQRMKSAKDKLMQQQHMFSSAGHNGAEIPSVLVSPVSPLSEETFAQSRHSSHSSSTSPYVRQGQQNTVPLGYRQEQPCKVPLRPSLKVTTRGMTSTSPQTNRSPIFRRTDSSSRFPNVLVPVHVQEDMGYDQASSSWQSGDDQRIMADFDSLQEPSSATSTTSRKSVSFATPPQVPTHAEPVVNTNSSWNSAVLFDSDQLPFVSHTGEFYWPGQTYSSQPDFCAPHPIHPLQSRGNMNNNVVRPRPDSAYGTLSSKPSESSINDQDRLSAASLHPQHAFVDPRMVMNNGTEHFNLTPDNTNNFSFLFNQTQGGQMEF